MSIAVERIAYEHLRETTCARPRKATLPDGSAVLVRCKSKHAWKCTACAYGQKVQTMRLIGSGCNVNERDGITAAMLEPFAFYFHTLTAPSFGRVNIDGSAVDARKYLYRRQVEWNGRAHRLFRSTTELLERRLPESAYFAVAEWQRRGTIHYHSLIRVPRDLDDAFVFSVLQHELRTQTHDGIKWGSQADTRRITGSTGSRVAYAAKVVAYTAKTQDGGTSSAQGAHQDRLDAAARRVECRRIGCVAGSCDGKAHGQFGFTGHLSRYSDDWSLVGMTRASLAAEARAFAEQHRDDTQHEQRMITLLNERGATLRRSLTDELVADDETITALLAAAPAASHCP